jgi:cation:H+ antiporter
MAYLQLLAGMALLLAGAELLVRGAVSAAKYLRVSPLLIGLTVVAFGTSVPEFVVSIDAVLKGFSGIAMGTIVGSNVANVLLVLGVMALFQPRQGGTDTSVVREVNLVIASGLLSLLFMANGTVERWQGAVLFALLLAYIYTSYRAPRRRAAEAATGAEAAISGSSVRFPAALLPVGIAGLWVGSELLVPAAMDIAVAWSVSDKVIGVVLVAVGTSMPELATSLVAAVRRHEGIAIGNVVGSNLFNIHAVLGATAAIVPVEVAAEVLSFDIWVMLAVPLLVIPYAKYGDRAGRLGGAALLALYAAYVASQFLGAPEALLRAGFPPW